MFIFKHFVSSGPVVVPVPYPGPPVGHDGKPSWSSKNHIILAFTVEMQAPASHLTSLLATFETLILNLRDHPAQDIIMGLTKQAELHINEAYLIVEIISAKLGNIATPPSYKLPLFYLMDSIMKNVGGPYAAYFSKNIVIAFIFAYDNCSANEKIRYQKLLTTWEERNTFIPDILIKLRTHINNSINFNPNPYPPTIPVAPSLIAPPIMIQQMPKIATNQQYYTNAPTLIAPPQLHAPVWTAPAYNNILPPPVPHQQIPMQQIPMQQMPQIDRKRKEREKPIIVSEITRIAEMQALLDKMYVEMGANIDGAKLLTLAEIKIQNPKWYQDLETTAEKNCVARIKANMDKDDEDDDTNNITNNSNIIFGYINDNRCSIELPNMKNLIQRLNTNADNDNDQKLKPIEANLAFSLQHLIDNLPGDTDSLPPMLLELLPLEPSKEWSAKHKSSMISAKPKLPVPVFKVDELGRNPEFPVKALYNNRPYQAPDTAVRFKTSAELMKFTDLKLENKKKEKELNSNGENRYYRQWYSSVHVWVSNLKLGATTGLGVSSMNKDRSNMNNINTNDNSSTTSASTKKYICTADDLFVRCPISKEAFETVWDQSRGELIYVNAVKVYLNDKCDDKLYKLAQLASSSATNNVKYMIVNKLLVMDGWINDGRASTFKEIINRYGLMGRKKENDSYLMNIQACIDDEGEDEEECFVLLERS